VRITVTLDGEESGEFIAGAGAPMLNSSPHACVAKMFLLYGMREMQKAGTVPRRQLVLGAIDDAERKSAFGADGAKPKENRIPLGKRPKRERVKVGRGKK
jgi:hypothetical protein